MTALTTLVEVTDKQREREEGEDASPKKCTYGSNA